MDGSELFVVNIERKYIIDINSYRIELNDKEINELYNRLKSILENSNYNYFPLYFHNIKYVPNVTTE